jgi:hypothetical protein
MVKCTRTYRTETTLCCWIEILVVVTMKRNLFWYMTPCSSIQVRRRFGATTHTSSSGSKEGSKEASSKKQAANRAFTCYPENGGTTELHSITFKTIVLLTLPFLPSAPRSQSGFSCSSVCHAKESALVSASRMEHFITYYSVSVRSSLGPSPAPYRLSLIVYSI